MAFHARDGFSALGALAGAIVGSFVVFFGGVWLCEKIGNWPMFILAGVAVGVGIFFAFAERIE